MNEHIVKFSSGHDCIKFECIHGSDRCFPGSGGSHGKHGMEIRFVSKGQDGAVQFLLFTGWLPQSGEIDVAGAYTMAATLGYYSKLPHHDGQNVMSESCEYCDGNPCYYGGSSLQADDAFYTLLNGGDAALWKFLDQYYDCVFHDGEYPDKVEYSKPLRDSK